MQHEEMQKEYMDDLRFAKMPVDTTLAIYRAGYHHYSVWGTDSINHTGECKSLRTIHPKWQAKHLSWYLTNDDLSSEEYQYYFNSLKEKSTHWSQIQSLKTIQHAK